MQRFPTPPWVSFWYSTSFGQRSEIAPLETPPMLQKLSDDCLGHVLFYLDILSIHALKLIGNKVLWIRTQHSCRELRYEIRNTLFHSWTPSITFPALKLASSGFTRLHTLSLQQHTYAYDKKEQTLIATLPSTLRNLTLEAFWPVARAFLAHDYAALFPELEILRLSALSQPTGGESPTSDDWARKLPKSMTYLGLHGVLLDGLSYLKYLCGIDLITHGGPVSAQDVRIYPLPSLRYLDFENRHATSFLSSLESPNGMPPASLFPPSLEYLRLFELSSYPHMIHRPPSFEHYLPSPALSSSSSSSAAISNSYKVIASTLRLKSLSTDVPVVMNVFPTEHLRCAQMHDLGALAPTLVSLALHKNDLTNAQVALLPPGLRYLHFHTLYGMWPTKALPHLTSLRIDKLGGLMPGIFFSDLPPKLRRLQLPTMTVRFAAEIDLLPPSLVELAVGCTLRDPLMLIGLPAGLQYLRLRVDAMDEPPDFSGLFARLPPNLLYLMLFGLTMVVPHAALGHLPRTLHTLQLDSLVLPKRPVEEKSFSSWLKRKLSRSESEPHVPSNTELVDECLELLPPGCKCSAKLYRDGEEVSMSVASVPHVFLHGLKDGNVSPMYSFP